MALIAQTKHVDGVFPAPTALETGEVMAVRGSLTLSANPTDNDTTAHVVLPAGCLPVDLILDASDLDTNGTPTIAISAGVLNAAKTDIDTAAANGGAAWIVTSTVAQAGGLVRPTTNTITRCSVSTSDRVIGLKYTTASATFASGIVGVTLLYRHAPRGE